MIEIENTSSMNEYLGLDETEVVKFPARTNILLVDGAIDLELMNRVDSVATVAQRSLHLC